MTLDRAWNQVEDLLRTESDHAFRLAVRILDDRESAKDVLQDSALAVYRSLEKGIEIDNLRAYYLRAVCNRALNQLRDRKPYAAEVDPIPGRSDEASGSSIESEIEARERSWFISSGMKQLPEKQCEAILLRFYAGMSTAEVADAMDISSGAAKTHLARGLLRLKDILQPLVSKGDI